MSHISQSSAVSEYNNLVPFQEEELTAAAVRIFIASSHAHCSVCYKRKRNKSRSARSKSRNYGSNEDRK